MREIDTGAVVQHLHDLGEVRLVVGLSGDGLRNGIRMLADADDLASDLIRRQYKVHAPRGDGAVRHPLVLGRRILRERDAALGLDRFQSESAVRGRARQDHADGLMPPVFRQRAKELIDRPVNPLTLARQKLQRSECDDHAPIGRDHVDVVRLDRRLVVNFRDGHFRRPRKNLCQRAGVSGG